MGGEKRKRITTQKDKLKQITQKVIRELMVLLLVLGLLISGCGAPSVPDTGVPEIDEFLDVFVCYAFFQQYYPRTPENEEKLFSQLLAGTEYVMYIGEMTQLLRDTEEGSKDLFFFTEVEGEGVDGWVVTFARYWCDEV